MHGRAVAITPKWPASTKWIDWEHFCQIYHTKEHFDSSSPINRANAEVLSVPQYGYNPTPTTSSRTFSGSQNDEAWNRFNNILKKQEDLVAAKNNSPYAQVLASFHWLLNKLLRSVGDDMCMEFYR
ncbi:PREDICTED: uncharacterized protein LOC108978164 [Bactrocera latifrons]|uniref:uncharacterized protein LOC108978164 n=1 Tax=Bactrocera latifrons TaxID=174628 RepID=UPI0008DE2D18|nr:PREDICTED: uncharacterized protein LOC108978164 [Bactrocera latifrons]